MATREIKNATPASSKGVQPWWQLILIYPAFAIALLTAVPNWIDRGLAAYHGVQSEKFSLAERQVSLWKRNFKCLQAPTEFHSNLNNVKVDATICKRSGDIFVQVLTPEQKSFNYWVALEDIIKPPKSSPLSLIAGAEAAEMLSPQEFSENSSRIELAQNYATLVCQKFVDQRMILRHFRTPHGCYDEIIDTYNNGAVVSRTRVPCREGC